MEDFPSNSQRKQLPRKEEPKTEQTPKAVHKVVEGQVVRRKKPIGKRLREAFLGDDNRTVLEMIVQDVLIPNIRDTVFEAGQRGLESSIYGASQSFRRGGVSVRPNDPRRHTNYNGISRGGPRGRLEEERQMSRQARARHDFGELVIPNRPEAEAVLEGLFALLDEYDVASVADLYELAGLSSQFTDRKWGWTDLRGTDIRRVRDGWLLDLPRPEVID